MKDSALLAAFGGLVIVGALQAEPAADPNVAEAKAIIQAFFGNLKGKLETAMQAGGPARAVKICNAKAPQIAADVSAKTGWDVGRTSLELRNPAANAPDALEKAVLVAFEERKSQGGPVETMAHAGTIEANGEQTFRFMRAIPTAELCLTCHGTDLAPEVAAEIDAAYPDDEARGFELGDIRGAFTLSKSWQPPAGWAVDSRSALPTQPDSLTTGRWHAVERDALKLHGKRRVV